MSSIPTGQSCVPTRHSCVPTGQSCVPTGHSSIPTSHSLINSQQNALLLAILLFLRGKGGAVPAFEDSPLQKLNIILWLYAF
ncbi:hypothetical protein ACQ1Q5_02760 [Ornithobacterium rhinotracheale]